MCTYLASRPHRKDGGGAGRLRSHDTAAGGRGGQRVQSAGAPCEGTGLSQPPNRLSDSGVPDKTGSGRSSFHVARGVLCAAPSPATPGGGGKWPTGFLPGHTEGGGGVFWCG